MSFLGDDYFLYKGHILKAKQGEWVVDDAIREFDKESDKSAQKHVNPDACPKCKALNNKAKICPYCGYERR